MDSRKYAELFRTESREQLSAVNRALLRLEQGDASRESVDAVFRGVHTIKGMSATMGYTAVAEFAHELESLLDKVREGAQTITAELMDALFVAADALEDGVERPSTQAAMGSHMREALERLHDVAGGRSTAEFRIPRLSGPMAMPVDALDAQPLAPDETLVTVTQASSVALPGVRAFMVLQRLRALGQVLGSEPAEAQLQAATAAMRFRVRLRTNAGPSEIEAAVRAVGEIAALAVDAAAAPSAAQDPPSHPMRRASDVFAAEALGPAERGEAPRARHVRIELSRLDRLLDLIGELVIVRGRLQTVADGLRHPALNEAMREASRLVGDLQAEVMTSRLVPVGQVFDRFPRLVRDVARRLGKDVLFAIEGKEIEIDRSVLDEIGEPVVHLLRNAVDHGLETPAEREAAGKPRAGRLTLSAQRERNAVVISVRDDGRGIDRAKVLARALARGLVPADTTDLDDDALLRCIAHPGLSTAESVSEVSGRGVGVDAVLSRTRALGGSVFLSSAPRTGTTLTLRLPVTLAIVRAVLARVGDERYALPLTHVRETLAHEAAAVRREGDGEVFVLRDEALPLLRLREVLRLPGAEAPAEQEVVVIARGDRRAGLVVDELTGQEDIVVKRFDDARGGVALFSGATILDDGSPALIVDVGSLL